MREVSIIVISQNGRNRIDSRYLNDVNEFSKVFFLNHKNENNTLFPDHKACDCLIISDRITETLDRQLIESMQNEAYSIRDCAAICIEITHNAAETMETGSWSPKICINSTRGLCTYWKAEALQPCAEWLTPMDFIIGRVDNSIKQLGYCIYYTADISLAVQGQNIPIELCYEEDRQLFLEMFEFRELISEWPNNKKNLMYLIQADFRMDASDNIGGTQLHVKDLYEQMKNDYNVFIAARNSGNLQITYYGENGVYTFRFPIGEPSALPALYSKRIAEVFEYVLKAFRIDILHVHHIYGLSSEIFEIAHQLGIRTVTTLHDFYYLCPTIKLLDEYGQYCAGNAKEEKCRTCLKTQYGISEELDYRSFWRDHMQQLLLKCDAIITPSENAKNIYLTCFPTFTEKIHVIEHGYASSGYFTPEGRKKYIDDEKLQYNIEKIEAYGDNWIKVVGWCRILSVNNGFVRTFIVVTEDNKTPVYIPTSMVERGDVANGDERYLRTGFNCYIPCEKFKTREVHIYVSAIIDNKEYTTSEYKVIENRQAKKSRLNIAFIGGLNHAKGTDEIKKILQCGIKDINWYVFGGIDDRGLHENHSGNLLKTGFYNRDELKLYLDLYKIDIVAILSVWPETFCYTLSEALLCGRPVIVTDIGAHGDRVRAMNCGWLCSMDNVAGSFVSIIKRLDHHNKMLLHYNSIVSNLIMKDLTEMGNEYKKLYASLAADDSKTKENVTWIWEHLHSNIVIDKEKIKSDRVENAQIHTEEIKPERLPEQETKTLTSEQSISGQNSDDSQVKKICKLLAFVRHLTSRVPNR